MIDTVNDQAIDTIPVLDGPMGAGDDPNFVSISPPILE